MVRANAPSCRQTLLFKGIQGVGSIVIPDDPVGKLMQLTTIEIEEEIGDWNYSFIVPRPVPRIRIPYPIATSSTITVIDDTTVSPEEE